MARSAEYRAAAVQAYALAGRLVEKRSGDRSPGSWAVILDSDQTVLDNVGYEIERARQGLGFTLESWNAWCAQEVAEAVPGAADFLRHVRRLGGRIFLVTNRTTSIQEHTEANLRALGIPFDAVLSKPEGSDSSKAPRWRAVEDGTAVPGVGPLEVLLWVGDNIRDFPGLDQSLRHEERAAFTDFGQRFVILPNPIYGSWTGSPD